MSDAIFPALKGLQWDQEKIPIFSTRIHRSVNGREHRAPDFVNPLWQYNLSYDLLRDDGKTYGSLIYNELKTLFGFYLQRQGAFDTFLYDDPSDDTVSGQHIYTGDGTQVAQFQIIRTYGGFTEQVAGVKTSPAPTVYIDGVARNPAYWSITAGILDIGASLYTGQVVTMDFQFYKRVRFLEYQEGGSGSAFVQFAKNLWELKSCSLITVRPGD